MLLRARSALLCRRRCILLGLRQQIRFRGGGSRGSGGGCGRFLLGLCVVLLLLGGKFAVRWLVNISLGERGREFIPSVKLCS